MSLTKSATLNDGGDGKLDIGDTITYTLTLSNTGNVSLTSVSLSDTITDLSGAALGLQSGPTYISGGTSFASTSTMEVGDVIVYEAVFEINQASDQCWWCFQYGQRWCNNSFTRQLDSYE
jgi:hypothetical protein